MHSAADDSIHWPIFGPAPDALQSRRISIKSSPLPGEFTVRFLFEEINKNTFLLIRYLIHFHLSPVSISHWIHISISIWASSSSPFGCCHVSSLNGVEEGLICLILKHSRDKYKKKIKTESDHRKIRKRHTYLAAVNRLNRRKERLSSHTAARQDKTRHSSIFSQVFVVNRGRPKIN